MCTQRRFSTLNQNNCTKCDVGQAGGQFSKVKPALRHLFSKSKIHCTLASSLLCFSSYLQCTRCFSEFWCMSRDSNVNELKLGTPFLKCPKEFTLPHLFAILNLTFCPFLNLWINPDSVDYVVSTYVHICTRTASYCTLGRHNLFGFALNLCSHRLNSLIFSPGILITCWLALTVATSRNTMQWTAFSRLCDRFAFNATQTTNKVAK